MPFARPEASREFCGTLEPATPRCGLLIVYSGEHVLEDSVLKAAYINASTPVA